MTTDWQDQLAGARMRVDQEFEQQVADSRFSSQEWGLIMTAVEFEIRSAEDPEEARLVAETGKVEAIVPELDRIQDEMGGSPQPVTEGSSGGILGRLNRYLDSLTGDGGSGESNEEQLADARALADEYAEHLQAYLEERGRWAEVCEQAARQG